jgi:hypothetical protein
MESRDSANIEENHIKNQEFYFFQFWAHNGTRPRGIQRSTYKRMKKTNKEDMTHFVMTNRIYFILV